MNNSVVIMNFSGVYESELFSKDVRFAHLDCTHLNGTDCYCDTEGAQCIRSLIAPYTAEGVHFIDSGNYHYVSEFWMEKIDRPFSLVLFDHHTDMQPARFPGLLSCGGWVKHVLDTNPLLRHLFLLGIPEEMIETIPSQYRERVRVFTDRQLHDHSLTQRPLSLSEPVYISIDKDVLDPHSASTNWDQGILTLDELRQILLLLLQHEEVIGVDICGECRATLGLLSREVKMDNAANRKLLHLFQSAIAQSPVSSR